MSHLNLPSYLRPTLQHREDTRNYHGGIPTPDGQDSQLASPDDVASTDIPGFSPAVT
ncbi:hypothetical protein LTS18_005860, partial [Coniosporium uncinatum]